VAGASEGSRVAASTDLGNVGWTTLLASGGPSDPVQSVPWPSPLPSDITSGPA
jgi:hypothetical protein